MMWLLYIVGAISALALFAIFAKAGMKKGDPYIAAGLSAAAMCVFSYVISSGAITVSKLLHIDGKGLVFILLSGIALGGALIFFFKSIRTAQVINVVPVVKLYLIIEIIAGGWLFRSHFTTNKIIAAVLMVVGTVIMIIGSSSKGTQWIVEGLIAAVLMSASSIAVKYGASSVNGSLLRFVRLLIAVIVIWIVVLSSGGNKKLRSMSFLDGIFLCLSGVFMGLNWMFYSRGMAIASDSNLALSIYRIDLLIVLIFGSLFLKEKTSGKHYVGVVLYIAGLEVLLLNVQLTSLLKF